MLRREILALTAVCLLTLIALPAQSATIRLAADKTGTATTISAAPYIPFTFYTLADGFDPGTTISKYEFNISLPDNVLSLGYIPPLGAYNVGYSGDYRITATLPLDTDAEPVLLGTHIAVLTADVSDALITLGPASIGSFDPAAAGYTDPAGASYAFGAAGDLLINQINLPTPHTPEPATLVVLALGCLMFIKRR